MSSPIPTRNLSLDVLRGMTVCFMIIVNSPGTGATPFGPLEHAAWHGFTPTDLVFPCFLFVVGNAMAFAMKKFNGLSNTQVVWKILRRSAIIFLLGYLMYWFPFFHHTEKGWVFNDIGHTRIMGVLQRIGLCYGIASLMIWFLPKRMVWILSLIFLFGYWALLYFGGDYSMAGNLGQKLDLAILGPNHLYNGEGMPFDPEGILSTMPAIVNVVIGYYVGLFIREKGSGYETVAKLLLAAAALISIAYFWHWVFPINKKLWTSPFVLYTCGLAMMILGALTYFIDIRNVRGRWTDFFGVFGKNPLFIYLLSEIILILFWVIPAGNGQSLYEAINASVFQRLAPGPIGSLLFALTVMSTCWLVGWLMDKRNIYIRV